MNEGIRKFAKVAGETPDTEIRSGWCSPNRNIQKSLIGKSIQIATDRLKTENINVILIELFQKQTR
jgi:hypothetical protein